MLTLIYSLGFMFCGIGLVAVIIGIIYSQIVVIAIGVSTIFFGFLTCVIAYGLDLLEDIRDTLVKLNGKEALPESPINEDLIEE